MEVSGNPQASGLDATETVWMGGDCDRRNRAPHRRVQPAQAREQSVVSFPKNVLSVSEIGTVKPTDTSTSVG